MNQPVRALPALEPDEVARTCRPLEEAHMLPRAAFTDPGVLEWELEELFRGGAGGWGGGRASAPRGPRRRPGGGGGAPGPVPGGPPPGGGGGAPPAAPT